MNAANRDYRFLDTEAERRELIADIARARQAVVRIAESVPPEQHYEPRYHGWSLGAMLAHLYVTDKLSLWLIQWALVGVRPPVPLSLMHVFNAGTSQVFRKRLVSTTLRGIHNDERKIAEFIQRLPIDKFTKPVYVPTLDAYQTVERAVQDLFLYHWQEHLQTMQRAEGVYDEPPERTDTV